MTEIETHEMQDIINPEVPGLPEEKLELLQACLATLAGGGRVEGVTPSHVSIEGLQTLQRARKAGKRAIDDAGQRMS